MYTLVRQKEAVNRWMERFGVRFGIYKNGDFKEQIFPFDPIPRIISHSDWLDIEAGLVQRVKALNHFFERHIWFERNCKARCDTRRIYIQFEGLFASVRRFFATEGNLFAYIGNRFGASKGWKVDSVGRQFAHSLWCIVSNDSPHHNP